MDPDLTFVDEVHDDLEVGSTDPTEVETGVLLAVELHEDSLEEHAGGGEDNLVGIYHHVHSSTATAKCKTGRS